MKIIIGIMFLLTLLVTPVSATEQSAFEWEDIDTFCNTQQEIDFDICVRLIEEYQIDTIDRISKNNTENTKSLKKAVDDIGNTLREQIIIPDGVRIQKYQQQQIQ